MEGQHNLSVEDITRFLEKHQETKIRSTVLGSSEFGQLELRRETPRRVSLSSKHRRRRRRRPETQVMSITSGDTRRSSIFDSVESSSSTSSVLPGYVLVAFSCFLSWANLLM